MKKVSNAQRILGMMLVFGAVGALGLSALPNAAAMPHNSPSITFLPAIPVVNGNAPTIVLTTPGDGSTPTLDIRIGVEEPPSTGVVTVATPVVPDGSGFGGDCGLPAYSSGAGSYWVFQSGGSTAEFDMMSPGDTISLLFAPGVINPIYTGTATGPASGMWVDQNLVANKAPSIDFLTDITVLTFLPELEVYEVLDCGWDTGIGGVQTINLLYQNEKIMLTQLSMAGEILPIEATSLVLGAISTPTMMLPLLAIAAGGAFVYLRFQVLRKD